MILTDVNVLIYAFREDAVCHGEYKHWLGNTLTGTGLFGISDVVLSAVIRITTHPKIFARPSTLPEVVKFTSFLLQHPNSIRVSPGEKHWDIFVKLCKESEAKGNIVTDAYLAALAIESGAEWITTDRDFARFPGLKWRHPLAAFNSET